MLGPGLAYEAGESGVRVFGETGIYMNATHGRLTMGEGGTLLMGKDAARRRKRYEAAKLPGELQEH